MRTNNKKLLSAGNVQGIACGRSLKGSRRLLEMTSERASEVG